MSNERHLGGDDAIFDLGKWSMKNFDKVFNYKLYPNYLNLSNQLFLPLPSSDIEMNDRRNKKIVYQFSREILKGATSRWG